jgi:hypothetical protein
MEIPLRASLIGWLASDPALAGMLNSVTEEAPVRATVPWLAMAASSSVDWSTKTEAGFETRIALELHMRGDGPGSGAALVELIQSRVAALPRAQEGFRVVTLQFLRSRAEQRAQNIRAVLLEYRFRSIVV